MSKKLYILAAFLSLGLLISGTAALAACPDDICDEDENYLTCPADCPISCGDGYCNGEETIQVCPEDCGGESIISSDDFETIKADTKATLRLTLIDLMMLGLVVAVALALCLTAISSVSSHIGGKRLDNENDD